MVRRRLPVLSEVPEGGRHLNRTAIAILLALIALVPLAASAAEGDDAETSDMVLLDLGNGITYWSEADASAGDCVDLARSAASALGLGFEADGSRIVSIGGMEEHAVGEQICGWLLYRWDGSAWIHSEDTAYSGGSIAWGFYPDPSIVPAETPDSRTAWTQHRGDSSSSGYSGSYGTLDAKSPMEWYRTYTSGYVDSSIIVAGDLLYHTTGGAYGAPGSDRNPWVHCLNRLTGEIVWEFMMSYGAGYEVTSPLVIGDMLIVTATNWNVYCFDRFTGEVLHTLTLDQQYPYDDANDVAWNGRTFFTGATTPVYDSGAMYFGTADGHVMAYTVTREGGFEMLWDYDPDDTYADGTYRGIKGCFYYHAPVIAEVDGTRMLFIGSYEGYLYALDASTGAEIWVTDVASMSDFAGREDPGSAASVTVLSDGRLLVEWTDGEMSPEDGFVVCLDASTGRGPDGSDYHWKVGVLISGAVAVDGGFYVYAQPAVYGDSEIPTADGGSVGVVGAIYGFDNDGRVVWVSEECQFVKAALTLADGVIYTVDYTAGQYWPNGGGVTAYSAEDGSMLWRLKLSPSSADSYNMVAVTVIDGKLYVGNDYGAVYCISDIAGPQVGDEGEIVLENGFYHWSWYALIALVVLMLIVLWRLYRCPTRRTGC